jgi:hypothetical protein
LSLLTHVPRKSPRPAPPCTRAQLSLLRLFHQLLSDASLRKNKENKEVLLLATHVVRGLFGKLAAPGQDPGGGGSKPPGAAGQGAGAAAAAAAAGAGAARHAEEEEVMQEGSAAAQEREAQRRGAVSGMLCVELLFWKHPHTCDQINKEYSLRENDRWVWWWCEARKEGGACWPLSHALLCGY